MSGKADTENFRVAGVLGGMGPDATVDFMSKVLSMTPAEKDQDHVRMLVDQNPAIPDRKVKGDAQRAVVEAVLAEMALGLEAAGADFLVMPCNTAHAFLSATLQQISIPFVHIVNETVQAIREAEPEARSVGLLAIDTCLDANLYQPAIHAAGMSVLQLSVSEQAAMMQLIFRIKRGDQSLDVSHEMINLANSLIQQGADVIIAGCTEIPLVISAERLTVPFISSTDVLAEHTVAICLGQSPLPST